MRTTTKAAAVTALVLGLTLPSTAAAAAVPTGGSPIAVGATAAGTQAQPAAKPSAKPTAKPTAKPVRKPVAKPAKKPRRTVTRLVAGGLVTAVDAAAGTVTFTVRGGRDRSLRGTDLTVTVAEKVRVVRDDESATLADVLPGDTVRVRGVKTETGYTVTRVTAESPQPLEEPAPETTPTPTPEPTPEPTV